MIAALHVLSPFALLPTLLLPWPAAVLIVAGCAVAVVTGLAVREIRAEDTPRVTVRLK